MNLLVEYIACAIRYATVETGLKDWSGSYIIVNEFELDGKQEMLGMPVLIVPMRAIPCYSFTLAYPFGIDGISEKALLSVLEFQDIYKVDNF